MEILYLQLNTNRSSENKTKQNKTVKDMEFAFCPDFQVSPQRSIRSSLLTFTQDKTGCHGKAGLMYPDRAGKKAGHDLGWVSFSGC